MKIIVAPVNFSAHSNNAARYAADMALSIQVGLHLFYVLQIPLTAVDIPMTDYIMEELHETAENSLKALREDLLKRTGGKLPISTTLEVGPLESHLEAFCSQKNPVMVIMGSTGDSFEIPLVGSEMLAAIGHLPYPIIVVPPGLQFHLIKKIVLASEFKDIASEQLIGHLKPSQDLFNASVEVLHINTEKNNLSADQISKKYPQIRMIQSNSVEDGINQYLRNNDIDLLFVFPKKHNLLEFHRSHAKKIAAHAPVPVMSIHV
jgi:nucleotide-binding universal stress UspA family protein